jgi:hypothetical protein
MALSNVNKLKDEATLLSELSHSRYWKEPTSVCDQVREASVVLQLSGLLAADWKISAMDSNVRKQNGVWCCGASGLSTSYPRFAFVLKGSDLPCFLQIDSSFDVKLQIALISILYCSVYWNARNCAIYRHRTSRNPNLSVTDHMRHGSRMICWPTACTRIRMLTNLKQKAVKRRYPWDKSTYRFRRSCFMENVPYKENTFLFLWLKY